MLYHYITVPGHPSDFFGTNVNSSCTITLQFRGIHPTSDNFITIIRSVPLHYSSGASIRQKHTINGKNFVPLHYSSGASIRHIGTTGAGIAIRTITLQFRGIHPTFLYYCSVWENKYHYITVPGHPSDLFQRWYYEFVPLHYSSGASIRRPLYVYTAFEHSTITLQFRGIHPTLKYV